MTDKERTCLFHYVQSMIKYTEKWIADEFQEQHKSLCKQYRDASPIEDADRLFDALQAWYGCLELCLIRDLMPCLAGLHGGTLGIVNRAGS